MSSHPEFGSLGTAPVQAWRINNFVPVVDAPAVGGLFSEGDCYVVLQTKQRTSRTEYNVFFWLGKDSSQDERGSAALKTVELDECLGGSPTQYREVQGHESKNFFSLFPSLQYQAGGVASGFREVKRDQYDTTLLHLKGHRQVRVSPCAKVCHTELNAGDVFILDAGLQIFVWCGSSSSRVERGKGLEVSRSIRNDERGGRAKIYVIEQGDEGDDVDAFWSNLGGKGAVAEATGCDKAASSSASSTSLHKLSDSTGTLVSEEIATGGLTREMLDTNDVFVVVASAQVFIWVGKGSNKAERAGVWSHVDKFIADKDLPDWTPVVRIAENCETTLFKDNFSSWSLPVFKSSIANSSAPAEVAAKFDAATLVVQKRPEAEEMVDDGSGDLKIWRIENLEPASLDKSVYGNFYSGDSYIVQYTYEVSNKEKNILYFWQGKNSTADEKGAAALHVVKMDEDLNGEPVQCRVVEGKEPAHFLALFDGKMIVHKGGAPSGFKNASSDSLFEADNEGLFRIRGTSNRATRTIEVEATASSLNSNDVFIFQGPENQYVWNGIGATEEERAISAAISEILAGSKAVESFNEGEEPEAFWTALGGKGEYTNTPESKEESREARLFWCSNASGAFEVEEVFNYDQSDLDANDVFWLDTHSEVAIWVGSKARADEKKAALQAAVDYTAASGRQDTPVFVIHQGQEPTIFTTHFVWDPVQAAGGEDAYTLLKAELASTGATGVAAAAAPVDAKAALADYDRTYTLAELKDRPEACDKSQLEVYLSDEEFKTTFKMDKAAFSSLPAWKRKNAKKAAGLF